MDVKKRDNTKELFQGEKISNALIRAFDACNKQVNFDVLDCVLDWVDEHPEDSVIDVEDIQNKIEECLMDYDKEVARSYIKYRYEHKLIRETRDSIIKGLTQKLTASNVQNQNANVDEYSFGGRLGEATSLVTKDYALKYCIGRKFKNAHENNESYTHDLDHYAVGDHNCVDYNSWIKINEDGESKTIKIGEYSDLLGLAPGELIDLSKKNIQILSRDGWTKLHNITCRETRDDEEVYTFKTRNGLPLKTTGEHKLPIIRNGKEIVVQAKDIVVGDSLISVNGINLSSDDITSNYLSLLNVDDDNLDLRITNLEPLRHYLRYKYGIEYTAYHKKMRFELLPNAKTLKLKDFLTLINDYPISYDLLSSLRIKNSGSKHNFPLNIPYSEALARIYAYVYADGGVYYNIEEGLSQLTFTNKNEHLVDRFINDFEEVFGVKLHKQKPSSWDKTNNLVYRATFGDRLICKIFKDYAGGKKYGANDISVPNFVINGNDGIKYAFLSAAIDCDGCLSKEITYSSCSPKYCEQLVLMLQGLGYHPFMVQDGKRGDTYKFGLKTGKRNFDSFSVRICRNDEKKTLYEHIDTLKKTDQYSYKGIQSNVNDERITSITKENIARIQVYDLETGNHWFIVNDYVSHNCLSEPMDLLFKNGFKTRQVDIRPPKSINTAMQLVAVAFQIQSLQQFGGVAATHLDWSMVPMVRMSFTKHIGDGLIYIERKSEYKVKRFHKWAEKNLPEGAVTFDNEEFKSLHPQVWEYAMDMTIKEAKQAVEGLYHNLNSLQSRSGCQLPFSSINYGTCTLPEGRMIIKALLEGSIEGVGKFHKTSIFPCGIFTWNREINAYKGTPNYDLYRLALSSSAKRIYPNYANGSLTSHVESIKRDRACKKKILKEFTEEQLDILAAKIKDNKELQEQLLLYVDKNGKVRVNEKEQPIEIMSTMGKW